MSGKNGGMKSRDMIFRESDRLVAASASPKNSVFLNGGAMIRGSRKAQWRRLSGFFSLFFFFFAVYVFFFFFGLSDLYTCIR